MPNYKILIVEDNLQLMQYLTEELFSNQELYQISKCYDGQNALKFLKKQEYQLLILDLVLPDRHGLQILNYLREMGLELPVLIMSAKNDVLSIKQALEAGADGYICKPFQLEEFRARVLSLLRRPPHSFQPQLTHQRLSIDLNQNRAYFAKKELPLRAKEFQLLKYFLEHPGKIVSKSELLERLWLWDEEPMRSVIDVHISNLRKRLQENCGQANPIQTVHARGYILK